MPNLLEVCIGLSVSLVSFNHPVVGERGVEQPMPSCQTNPVALPPSQLPLQLQSLVLDAAGAMDLKRVTNLNTIMFMCTFLTELGKEGSLMEVLVYYLSSCPLQSSFPASSNKILSSCSHLICSCMLWSPLGSLIQKVRIPVDVTVDCIDPCRRGPGRGGGPYSPAARSLAVAGLVTSRRW